jgi:hypothetical protein
VVNVFFRLGGMSDWIKEYSLPLTISFLLLQLIDSLWWNVSLKIDLTVSILLRLVLLNFAFACYSLYVQADGLSGPYGLIPLRSKLNEIRTFIKDISKGNVNLWNQPPHLMIVQLLARFTLIIYQDSQSIKNMTALCIICCLVGVVLTPHPLIFMFVYMYYYATRRVLPEFLNLQWDALVLELSLYGTLLSLCTFTHSSFMLQSGLNLFKICLFRLMFGSGMVKVFSRDESWRKCEAMDYHFQTQPLPGYLAKIMHMQPAFMLKMQCFFATFIVELLIPILSTLPRICSNGYIPIVTALVYAKFQCAVMVGGNFGFFNFLSLCLGMAVLDDHSLHIGQQWMTKILNPYLERYFMMATPTTSIEETALSVYPDTSLRWILAMAIAFPIFVFILQNFLAVRKLFKQCLCVGTEWKILQGFYNSMNVLQSTISVLNVGNHYGLFANMTKFRDEILIEVSDDYGDYLNKSNSFLVNSSASASQNKGKEKDCQKDDHNSNNGSGEKTDAYSLESKSTWIPIEFAYKPGSSNATDPTDMNTYKPVWPLFHMPRLDWRMWFLPLNPSIRALLEGIASAKIKAELQYDNPANEKAAVSEAINRTVVTITQQVLSILPKWFLILLVGILDKDETILSLLHHKQKSEYYHDKEANTTIFSDPKRDGKRSVEVQSLLDSMKGTKVDISARDQRYIRIRIASYTFNADNDKKGLWHVSDIRSLLPPTNISALYHCMGDRQHKSEPSPEKPGSTDAAESPRFGPKSMLSRLPDHLKPETAAQLIQRTLFNKDKSKGKSEKTK